jgi:hypothetical protein
MAVPRELFGPEWEGTDAERTVAAMFVVFRGMTRWLEEASKKRGYVIELSWRYQLCVRQLAYVDMMRRKTPTFETTGIYCCMNETLINLRAAG